MAYLLDANVLIEAKNRYYGFDICPGFWTWIERRHRDGIVYSVSQVESELVAGRDVLASWAQARGRAFFLDPKPPVLAAFPVVSTWVTTQQYEPAAINTFLQAADYYLIAQALAGGHTVVTEERPSASTRRVKIPEVCIGLGVPYLSTFEMLRRESVQFQLSIA